MTVKMLIPVEGSFDPTESVCATDPYDTRVIVGGQAAVSGLHHQACCNAKCKRQNANKAKCPEIAGFEFCIWHAASRLSTF
jgi:hypothetical protein